MAVIPFNKQSAVKLFKADDPNIHYIGRVDFTNPQIPRFGSAGVYIKAKFKGSFCEFIINDEVLYNINHNYLEIAIDDQVPYRIELTAKENIIKVAEGLANTTHVITICKDTESHIGYLDFIGFRCEQLLPLPAEPKRKIEFIGNSITSGAGMDQSKVPCNTGLWFDQHNAYMSYGARAARALNAQWQLTSVSGIGLIHSCCDLKITMPQVFDKVYLRKDSAQWDFKRYQPDVVTICLGQNDGIQDSTVFCGAYVKFIGIVRSKYPQADIICMSSPMADAQLTAVLKRYLAGTTNYVNARGDKKVHRFYFSRSYNKGCGGHPDMEDHQHITDELTAYIKQVKGW
ncbi:MAG TPA: SGNH/GDSL hydrolase family protein [Mucilaginibacter sp.]